MKSATWEQRYGAKRRAIDRALLAEVEKQIAAEEAANERIARAFGRPA